MNAVGIDVSKGKSTVAIMRPYGEIVASPFEISHTEEDFKNLTSQFKNLHGESRIIMEYTGRYYEPLANYLYNAGLRVALLTLFLSTITVIPVFVELRRTKKMLLKSLTTVWIVGLTCLNICPKKNFARLLRFIIVSSLNTPN